MLLSDTAPVPFGTYRYTYTPGKSKPTSITAEKTQYAYRLLIPTAGRLAVLSEGVALSVGVGEALLLPPGSRYRFTDPEVGFSLVNVTFGLFPSPPPPVLGCVPIHDYQEALSLPHHRIEDAPELSAPTLLRGEVEPLLSGLSAGGTRAASLTARASLLSLLAVLLSGDHPSPPAAAAEIVAYIRTHPTGDLSPSALAARFSYHKNHINRLVHRATGKPLSALVREVRVRYAKALIAEGGHSLTELAATLGYYDYSHLRRAFLQETGMTPTDYAATVGP